MLFCCSSEPFFDIVSLMPGKENPFVCIIIPFTRWNSLVDDCVQSVLKLSYDNYVIALLPNQKEEVPDHYKKSSRVLVVETQKSGISYKRNLAINHFDQADFYACIDSDAAADRNWISSAISAFERDNDIWLVGGPDIAPEYKDISWRVVANAERSFLVGGERAYRKKLSSSRYVEDLRSSNLFIKRECIESLRGFDENLIAAEDVALSRKVLQSGKKLFFSGDTIVFHHNRSLFKPYIKQKITLGYGVFNFFNSYTGVPLKNKILWSLPMVMVISLVTGWLSYWIDVRLFYLWAGSVTIYLLAVMQQGISNSNALKDIPLTWIAILVGNLGPGIGFWLAILRFPIKAEKFYKNYEKISG